MTVETVDPNTTSEVTDGRYYPLDRTDDGPGASEVKVAQCDERLSEAPLPSNNARPQGRRPHLHRDTEGHYLQDRIDLDPNIQRETSGVALIDPRALPKLYAYPSNEFDYANQNRRGEARGYDPGYGRIITDKSGNQLGFSYHPWGDPAAMVRAPKSGAFIASYK